MEEAKKARRRLLRPRGWRAEPPETPLLDQYLKQLQQQKEEVPKKEGGGEQQQQQQQQQLPLPLPVFDQLYHYH